jgi:hypothetical protein
MINMATGLGLALAFQIWAGGSNTIQGAAKPPHVHVPSGSGSHLTGVHHDVEIQTVDDVVVRRMKPKEEFDDNGKPRKLTAAEEREQKGKDPNLPGYNADVNDLANGQIVKLKLLKKKDSGKSTAKDSAKSDSVKEEKTEWVKAGTIAAKMKSSQGSSKTLILSVDTAELVGRHHRTVQGKNGSQKIALDDFRVSMITIMDKGQPVKDDGKKKK